MALGARAYTKEAPASLEISSLPLAEDWVAVILKPMADPNRVFKVRKAMILDSQSDQVARFQRLMAENSIELTGWVPSGAGWIAAWQKDKPDLVVVDYTLPKRDGLYCIERLRGLNEHCLTIFTHSYQGLSANDLEIKALSRGAFAVFQKPGVDARFVCALKRFHIDCEKIQSLKKVKM